MREIIFEANQFFFLARLNYIIRPQLFLRTFIIYYILILNIVRIRFNNNRIIFLL